MAHVVIGRRNLEILKYFIEEWVVDPNALDRFGTNVLQMAAKYFQNDDILIYLSNPNTLAMNVNKQGARGFSCLHLAAANNSFQAVQYFVEHCNVDLFIRDEVSISN